MPFGIPDYSAFNFRYPTDFIYKSVEESFLPVLQDNLLPYASVVEYLNSTITNSTIPEISDEGSGEQVNREGVKRKYKGSLPINEKIDKSFVVTMSMKSSYMNWAIMLANFAEYLKDEESYLPDCIVQLLDDYDHSIIELIFNQVQMRSISEINVNTTESGIVTREFDVKFEFNNWGIQTLFDRKMNQE